MTAAAAALHVAASAAASAAVMSSSVCSLSPSSIHAALLASAAGERRGADAGATGSGGGGGGGGDGGGGRGGMGSVGCQGGGAGSGGRSDGDGGLARQSFACGWLNLAGFCENLWSLPLSTICAARIHLYQNLSAANKNPSAESAHAAILHNPPAQHLESTHTSHPPRTPRPPPPSLVPTPPRTTRRHALPPFAIGEVVQAKWPGQPRGVWQAVVRSVAPDGSQLGLTHV